MDYPGLFSNAIMHMVPWMHSAEHLEGLRQRWNKEIKSHLCGVPDDAQESVTPEEALRVHESAGKFSASHLKTVLAATTEEDRIRRIEEDKQLLAAGVGLGYDIDFLAETAAAGLRLRWFDVSDDSIETTAKPYLISKCIELEAKGVNCLNPSAECAEIRNVILAPAAVGLYLFDVDVWYLSGILRYLSHTSVRFVLQAAGRSLSEEIDSHKKNAIVIIDDLSGWLNLKRIVWNIRHGAERALAVSAEDTHPFFTRTITAVIVRAK